jgi:Cupin
MGEVVSLEKPDALMDVLDMLKPRGRVYCCSEMSAPWAMSLPADGYARFHVIERGGAWLRMDGVKQVTPLASGTGMGTYSPTARKRNPSQSFAWLRASRIRPSCCGTAAAVRKR